MKKTVIFIGLLLITAGTVRAETNSEVTASPRFTPLPLRNLDRVQNRLDNRLETRLENLEQKREQYRERLQNLKDEKKQQILEHISNRIKVLNDRITKTMLRMVERLEALLKKIKDRVPAVDTTAAQAKIDEAKTAIATQATKEYIIEFTDETGLRAGASAAKQQFRADIQAVREKIRTARQAVADVLKAAKTL